jgi:ribosomal protein S18 acetylase RimI-like enzyme
MNQYFFQTIFNIIAKKKFMYLFEEMKISHYNQACELWKQTKGIDLTVGDSIQGLKKYLERNPGMSFVCSYNGTIIGTILCGHDGRRGFIYHLAVNKKHRNNHLAKSLIEKSTIALKNAGIERCSLMVKSDNEEAFRFWEKIGWKRRGDLFMFSKDLSSEH